jgi:indole-3-glycerol phosphate synthase
MNTVQPTILDRIIATKRTELVLRKGLMPLAVLEKFPFFERPTRSLEASLRAGDRSGIIAEFKRKSPSKGVINDRSTVEEVVEAYATYGASAISVLTDESYFGGNNDDLMRARERVEIPLLRKEFIVDEYQLVEAKAIGADIILLIAACLSPAEVQRLARTARGLGLEVLLELHGEEELGHVCDEVNLVGINNRDLKTFKVDLDRSVAMAEKLGKDKIKIAESGINGPEQVDFFRKAGFQGFLIGENFMKAEDPAMAFRTFVDQIPKKA